MPKTVAPSRAVRRMSSKARLEQIQALVQLCFVALSDHTTDVKEISNLTLLSVGTIYRLRSGVFTLGIHVGTLQALSMAAGLRFDLNAYGYDVRVVD